ncbi:hypothetical protein Aperf_G00000055358 [Anoplocephala perfoliata]
MSHLAWTSIYLNIPTQSPLHIRTLAITPTSGDNHLPAVMSTSTDLPSSGNGIVHHNITTTTNNNINKQSSSPPVILHPSPAHRRSSRWFRRKSKSSIIISSLLITVIILQIAIIGLILNSHYVQNTGCRSSLIVRAQAGKTPSELEVRGQMLQLADLLSWDAKCNRVLHDLVVSCYGAPDYLASVGKDQSKGGGSGGFQFNRSFPRNLEIPPRPGHKFRRLRPMKSASLDGKKNQSQLEKGLAGFEVPVPPQPNAVET